MKKVIPIVVLIFMSNKIDFFEPQIFVGLLERKTNKNKIHIFYYLAHMTLLTSLSKALLLKGKMRAGQGCKIILSCFSLFMC